MKNFAIKFYDRSLAILWVLYILALPFTSSPLVAKIMGGTMVATPSGLILFVLLIVWLLPKLWQGMTIPQHTLSLFLFILIALVSIITGYWRNIPAFKGINPIKENLEGIVTLVMGVCFYFVSYLWLREKNQKEEFNKTLRLITYAGIMIFIKAFLEIVLWRFYGRYPYWFETAHNLLVTGPLFENRISAFAFEPSWLANQLNLLFLPYWLASTITRTTAFKIRVWKFHVEDFCLILGSTVLFFTLSRLGYLSFLLMLGILIIKGTVWFSGWLQEKILNKIPGFEKKTLKILLSVFIYSIVFLFYVGLVFAAAYALNLFDSRNADIFNILLGGFELKRYAENLGFGARLAYWAGGWNIFTRYPFLGVGLGNAGFYFPDKLPSSAWHLVEVRRYFYETNMLLNVKSMGFRLLAETGIFGFSAFIAFLTIIFLVILRLLFTKNKFKQFMGWMGLFAFCAFLIEQFSLDSFALPYFWVTFGMITAANEIKFKNN